MRSWVTSFPLILSTGSWAVQHFVDRMFLAWYSAGAIAAAMPAGLLNFAIMSFFIGTASYVRHLCGPILWGGGQARIGPAVWQGSLSFLSRRSYPPNHDPFGRAYFQTGGS